MLVVEEEEEEAEDRDVDVSDDEVWRGTASSDKEPGCGGFSGGERTVAKR